MVTLEAWTRLGVTAAYIGTGVALRRFRVLDRRDGEALLRFAVNLTLPAFLVRVAISAPRFAGISTLVPVWLSCAFLNAALFVSARSAFRSVYKRKQRALMTGMPIGTNLGLFGYPLIESAFGPEGLAMAALYDLPNAFFVFGFAHSVFLSGRSLPADSGGRREHADGGVYDGEWKAGKKHGLGVYVYPSGAHYEGEWLEDTKHGRGLYTFPSGGSYLGEFTKGYPEGRGVRTSPTGKSAHGHFSQGQLAKRLTEEDTADAINAAASSAASARRVAKQYPRQDSLFRATLRKLCTFPPLLATVGGGALGFLGLSIPPSVDAFLLPLSQANRAAVMVALGLLLDLSAKPEQMRVAGDALVVRYSVCIAAAGLIHAALPPSLGPCKDALAAALVMPVPSVYIQYSIDCGMDSSAASLAVHASNAISFCLLLAFSTAASFQYRFAVPLTGLACLVAFLSASKVISRPFQLVQLRWSGGYPPNPPSQAQRSSLRPRASSVRASGRPSRHQCCLRSALQQAKYRAPPIRCSSPLSRTLPRRSFPFRAAPCLAM